MSTIQLHTEGVTATLFHQTSVCTSSLDGTVAIMDVSRRTPDHRWTVSHGMRDGEEGVNVARLGSLPGTSSLFCGTESGTLFRIALNEKTVQPLVKVGEAINTVECVSEHMIYLGTEEGTMEFHDLRKVSAGEPIQKFNINVDITCSCIDAESRSTLWVGTGEGSNMHLEITGDGSIELRNTHCEHPYGINHVLLTPWNSTGLLVCSGEMCHEVDINTFEAVRTYDGNGKHTDYPRALVLRGTNAFYSCGDDGKVAYWVIGDTSVRGDEVHWDSTIAWQAHSDCVMALDASSEASTCLVTGCEDGTIALWDVRTDPNATNAPPKKL